MATSLSLYLVMFPRLNAKRRYFKSFSKNEITSNSDLYRRAHMSYRLMALCTSVWSVLVAFYFFAWFVTQTVEERSMWASKSSMFFLDTFFEAISKVLYLGVVLDTHNCVFDEGQRSARRLEELRKMMSVLWDCSSDLVAISVKGWNGNITTMLNPAFLKLEGVRNSRIRAVILEQGEQEFVNPAAKAHSGPVSVEGRQRRQYWFQFEDGEKIYISEIDVHEGLELSLNSVAELMVKSWTNHSDQLISHNLISRGNLVIPCEAKVSKLESNALVVVVRDTSERKLLFEAEKKAIFEVTGKERMSKSRTSLCFRKSDCFNSLMILLQQGLKMQKQIG